LGSILFFQHTRNAYYISILHIHNSIDMFSLKTLYPGGTQTRFFCSRGRGDIHCASVYMYICMYICTYAVPRLNLLNCTASFHSRQNTCGTNQSWKGVSLGPFDRSQFHFSEPFIVTMDIYRKHGRRAHAWISIFLLELFLGLGGALFFAPDFVLQTCFLLAKLNIKFSRGFC
jgi:hypothetical protein